MTRTDRIDTFFMGVVYSLFSRERKGLSNCFGTLCYGVFWYFRLQAKKKPAESRIHPAIFRVVERDTRFELATSTLARLHSTTELVPLGVPLLADEPIVSSSFC